MKNNILLQNFRKINIYPSNRSVRATKLPQLVLGFALLCFIFNSANPAQPGRVCHCHTTSFILSYNKRSKTHIHRDTCAAEESPKPILMPGVGMCGNGGRSYKSQTPYNAQA